MSSDLDDTGSGYKFLVTCEYKGDMHLIKVLKGATLSNVYCELRGRWPEIDPQSTRLQYEAPIEKMLILLLKDSDVENMLTLHALAKAFICNLVASPTSAGEKRKR